MDGSENKSKFGISVIMVVFLIVCKFGEFGKGMSPYCHITDLDGKLKVILQSWLPRRSIGVPMLMMQEIMILPGDASSFWEAMHIGMIIYHN